jgi:hypothetical protein
MNKILYSVVLIVCLFQLNCNPANGLPGMSNSIKEARNRNVFISEYQPLRNPIVINDTLKLSVENCWVENHWIYPKNPNKTTIRDGYQLIVILKNKIEDDYPFKWTIGTSFKRNFRSCGSHCLISDFDSIPKISEEWSVQIGNDLYEGGMHEIIGRFLLEKTR